MSIDTVEPKESMEVVSLIGAIVNGAKFVIVFSIMASRCSLSTALSHG